MHIFNIYFICIALSMTQSLTSAKMNSRMIYRKDPLVLLSLQRPREFYMDIYSGPHLKGTSEHFKLKNGGQPPCWDVSSKSIGSVITNDPMVKITFYRAFGCRGASSFTLHSACVYNSTHNVSVKARSVKITKIRPVLLRRT
ncbi:hypothetical protein BDF14DRAFT_1838869 [Spinellus fusiger]|nr:hypothetical protein BDF14DRAFT_1838869 [Spinellus fusiger]